MSGRFPGRFRSTFVLLFALGVAGSPAFAQDRITTWPTGTEIGRGESSAPPAESGRSVGSLPSFKDLFKPLPGDFRGMVARENALIAGIGTIGAVAAHTQDHPVARSNWGVGMVHEALEPGQIVGGFYAQAGGALATYAIGRATGSPKVATLGAALFRAQVVAQGTTQAIKFAVGRTRPDGTSYSFPSGHTAAAFATASVLQNQLGWKAGVPAYAAATWVAASRVQMERHFMSDVIAGATVGILAGRSVTIGRGNTKFSVQPMPVAGGMGVSLTKIQRQ